MAETRIAASLEQAAAQVELQRSLLRLTSVLQRSPSRLSPVRTLP
jgi:hypothetical protein